jgi:hypothetical protein
MTSNPGGFSWWKTRDQLIQIASLLMTGMTMINRLQIASFIGYGKHNSILLNFAKARLAAIAVRCLKVQPCIQSGYGFILNLVSCLRQFCATNFHVCICHDEWDRPGDIFFGECC